MTRCFNKGQSFKYIPYIDSLSSLWSVHAKSATQWASKATFIRKTASIWRENMLGNLSPEIICSEKRTVFQGNCEIWGTDNVQGHLFWSPSTFSKSNGGYCVYYLSNIYVARAVLKIKEYLVNKPLQAAGMSADNVPGWEKNEHLAEKRSFEGKCEILRTISQPRTLSADIPASQKGVYLIIGN